MSCHFVSSGFIQSFHLSLTEFSFFSISFSFFEKTSTKKHFMAPFKPKTISSIFTCPCHHHHYFSVTNISRCFVFRFILSTITILKSPTYINDVYDKFSFELVFFLFISIWFLVCLSLVPGFSSSLSLSLFHLFSVIYKIVSNIEGVHGST